MRSFLVSLLVVLVAALGAAALVTFVPLAHVAAGAAVLLIAVVFSAARAGAPPWFGVRHAVGLLFAAAAILAHWGALIGLSGVGGGSAVGLAGVDAAAALDAILAPQGWAAAIRKLAAETSYAAGGVEVTGAGLAAAWAVEAGLLALFGLFGGGAARWRQRSRL